MRGTSLVQHDYRLTTAEILYHLPDFPELLQSYIWQKLDLAPEFPELHRFLDFWRDNLDGKLHSVRVATCNPLIYKTIRYAQTELRLH
jgi:uncharacterized protein Usg